MKFNEVQSIAVLKVFLNLYFYFDKHHKRAHLYHTVASIGASQTFGERQLPTVHPLDRHLRLPDVLERQGLFLNLLVKLVMSLILEKHLVVLEYFPTSLKILE